MTPDTEPKLLTLELSFQDILDRLPLSCHQDRLRQIAWTVFETVRTLWDPVAMVRWFDFETGPDNQSGRILLSSGEPVPIRLNASMSFLEPATRVMVSVCTIGGSIEPAQEKIRSKADPLEAYVMDIIGLAMLEKTGALIKNQAEEAAWRLGFGVSPYLSPGSVHGWDLEEQSLLCRLLPLEKIGVTLKDNGTLHPLKTITALIGIGPGYTAVKVGSTCDVCSRKQTCQMKQHH